jgi:hypothetical protein
MLSKFSPHITGLTKSWKCEEPHTVLTRENTTVLMPDQSKYLRTATLGRRKFEKDNSLVLHVSSETHHQDVRWIHLVRDESLEVGDKARENS